MITNTLTILMDNVVLASNMEKEHISMKMAIFMLENGNGTGNTVTVFILIGTEKSK